MPLSYLNKAAVLRSRAIFRPVKLHALIISTFAFQGKVSSEKRTSKTLSKEAAEQRSRDGGGGLLFFFHFLSFFWCSDTKGVLISPIRFLLTWVAGCTHASFGATFGPRVRLGIGVNTTLSVG